MRGGMLLILLTLAVAILAWTYVVGEDAFPLEIGPEFTIAAGVAPANSDTTTPGRPAIGFDGTNYLVVSCREIDSPTGIFGVIVSGEGVVLNTFHIAELTPVFGCEFPRPSVAFDGTNYLVVFQREGQIFGVRVSPSGTVLDESDGFAISSGTPFVVTNFSPAVAFDGSNYLVVWNKFIDNTHDIFGARVTPAGQVLDEFHIFRAPGGQVDPSVAFDGVNYLVIWSDTRSGSPVGPEADIFGTRVTPAGVVLDPEGISISTAPRVQSEPHVTFAAGNYLVAWVDRRNDPSSSATPSVLDIFGTRVTPGGALLDGASDTGGIAINTFRVDTFPPSLKIDPRVGFDGQHYLVVWAFAGFFPPAGVYAARVSTDGVLIDGPPDATAGILISEPACSACRLVKPNIHSSIQTSLVAWVNNSEVGGTAKDVLGAIVSSLTPLDHFLCYEAEGDDPVNVHVDLLDQFATEEQRFKVKRPKLFCNPVDKTHDSMVTEISDETAHLTGYKIKNRGKKIKRRVTLENQFGEQTVKIEKPKFLLVPTQKLAVDGELTGFDEPEALDHFKCYEVKKGKKVNVRVDLVDQFGEQVQVKVKRPKFFCNPVAKNGTFPDDLINPQAHLTCYKIEEAGEESEREVLVGNQFGEQFLEVEEPELLCVPSEKIEVRLIDGDNKDDKDNNDKKDD